MPDDAGFSRADLAIAAFVLAAVFAVLISSGVTYAEVFSYAAYLTLAIALPGILLCRLAGQSGRVGLADLCLGVPVGMAVQVLGFVGLAAVGLRRAGWFVAPAVGVLCLFALLQRRGRRNVDFRLVRGRLLEPVLIGSLCLASVGLLALRDFPQHPLPRDVGAAGLAYYRDMPWHLGNLSAAKRTWPLENPRMAGEPLHYHVGAYVFGAGTSTVTGIDVATLLFRLDPVMLVLLLGVQLVWMGRQYGGPGIAGVGTAFLVLLAGDASSLWRQTSPQFFNLFVTHLYLSPTYFLGLVLFLPLLVLSGKLIADDPPRRRADVYLWFLLLPACGLTKSTTLPVLAAAAAGFAGLHLIRRRALHAPALLVAGGAMVAFFAVWPVVIPPSAAEVKTMLWNPFGSLRLTPMWKALRSHMSKSAMTVIVLAGHAPAMLMGITSLAASRRPWTPARDWLAMLALAGAGPALLFTATGNGQLYFWFYGYVALAALASAGFAELLQRPATAVTRTLVAVTVVAGLIGTLSIVFQSRPGVKRIMGAQFRMFQANPDNQVPDRPAEITSGMAEGLLWIARNADPAAVIAVNDRSVNFYYSALSERPVFLEKTAPVVDIATITSIFERERAVGHLFGDAGPAVACETARHFGVDYLVNIKTPVRPLALDSSVLDVVFENNDIGVVSMARCRKGR